MGHRVDHRGGRQDQDVVLTRRYLHPVGVTDPEPPLGHLGHPLPLPLDGVLVVHDIALDPQVRGTLDLDRPPLAHRGDHGLLHQRHPVPARILDLHAVLDPQHALLDLAQLAAVHVLEHDRLADPQRLAVQLEHALAAIVLDHVIIADGNHPLTHLVTGDLRAVPAGFAALLATLAPPVPTPQVLPPVPRQRPQPAGFLAPFSTSQARTGTHHPRRASSRASGPLATYTDHDNGHRPHRSLQQGPPAGHIHPPAE